MRLPSPFDQLPNTAHRRIELVAKSALFHQGEPTRGVFFLMRGNLELRRVTENGDEIVLHKATAGSTFAEASLFAPTFHCNAMALVECSVMEIEKAAVLKLFATDTAFAMALTARFAGQVQSYRRRFEIMAIRSAEDRVYAALIDGMLTGSVKTLASEIGFTHEVVYRALAKLVKSKRAEKTARGQYRSLSSDT